MVAVDSRQKPIYLAPSLARHEVAVAVDLDDRDVRGKMQEVRPSVSDFNAQLETGPLLASARNPIAALESAEKKWAIVIAATPIVWMGIERTHRLQMSPESGLTNMLRTWRERGILKVGINSVCGNEKKIVLGLCRMAYALRWPRTGKHTHHSATEKVPCNVLRLSELADKLLREPLSNFHRTQQFPNDREGNMRMEYI